MAAVGDTVLYVANEGKVRGPQVRPAVVVGVTGGEAYLHIFGRKGDPSPWIESNVPEDAGGAPGTWHAKP